MMKYIWWLDFTNLDAYYMVWIVHAKHLHVKILIYSCSVVSLEKQRKGSKLKFGL